MTNQVYSAWNQTVLQCSWWSQKQMFQSPQLCQIPYLHQQCTFEKAVSWHPCHLFMYKKSSSEVLITRNTTQTFFFLSYQSNCEYATNIHVMLLDVLLSEQKINNRGFISLLTLLSKSGCGAKATCPSTKRGTKGIVIHLVVLAEPHRFSKKDSVKDDYPTISLIPNLQNVLVSPMWSLILAIILSHYYKDKLFKMNLFDDLRAEILTKINTQTQ